MIKVVLNIPIANVGYTDSKEHQESMVSANDDIYEYFLHNKIKFPIVPSVGMLVDLTKFYSGLSDNGKQWLDDGNARHQITDIVICNGYLELMFER